MEEIDTTLAYNHASENVDKACGVDTDKLTRKMVSIAMETIMDDKVSVIIEKIENSFSRRELAYLLWHSISKKF